MQLKTAFKKPKEKKNINAPIKPKDTQQLRKVPRNATVVIICPLLHVLFGRHFMVLFYDSNFDFRRRTFQPNYSIFRQELFSSKFP